MSDAVAIRRAGPGEAEPRLDVAVLTNARTAGQPSMAGYGTLLLAELGSPRHTVREVRAASLFGHLAPGRTGGAAGKMLRHADRFLVTPAALLLRAARPSVSFRAGAAPKGSCAGAARDPGATLVHVVDPGNAVYLPLLAADRTVVTVHDMIPHLCRHGELGGYTPTRTGRLLMDRILHAIRQADAVVAVSTRTADDLARLAAVPRERIRVIPNAPFQPTGTPGAAATAAFRRAIDVPPGAPLLMHIGRNFYKNRGAVLTVFERVAARRADACLVLIGAADATLGDALDRSPAREKVRLIGRIGARELAACYAAASVLVFPSHYEGFGYPVIEAQLAGTPVVCSNAGALPEVAGCGAFLREAGDIVGMADDVLALIGDRALAAALTGRGRHNAARFSVAGWRTAHHALYDELVRPG